MAAAGAGLVHALIRSALDHPHSVFARERPAEWLGLYRNHKSLCARLMQNHFGAEISRLSDVGERISRAKDWATFADLQREARLVFDEVLHTVLAEPMCDFATADLDPDKLQQDMDLAYYGFVVVPCMIRFDTLPALLYARARRGDLEALCKVLVLDAGVLEDPRIRRRVYVIRGSGTPGERRKLAAALDGKGYRFPSKKALKAELAGFLDRSFRGLDAFAPQLHARVPYWQLYAHSLNAPEFRKAFDAFAKDARGHETDIDLPEGDEAFYKSLRRAEGLTVLDGFSRTNRSGEMSE